MKHKIFVVLTIMLSGFLISCMEVKAEGFGGYIKIGEEVENYYYKIINKKTKQEIWKKSYFLYVEDEVVYSLESLKPLEGNKKSHYHFQERYPVISKELEEQIKRLAYFGYGSDNFKEAKWYAITQVAIWNLIDDENIYSLYQQEQDEFLLCLEDETRITNFMNRSLVLPDFHTPWDHQLSLYSAKALTDYRYVLSDYIALKTEHVKIKKTQNHIRIIAQSSGEENIHLKREFNHFQKDPTFCLSSEYQNILIPGNLPSIDFFIPVKVLAGSMDIHVYGEKMKSNQNKIEYKQEGLKDAIIALYAEEDILNEDKKIVYQAGHLIKNYETDKWGKIKIENLPMGKYYFKEVKNSDYVFDKNKIYNLEIDKENLSHSFTIENKLKNVNLCFYLEEENKPLKNTHFVLYKDDLIVFSSNTDANGKVDKKLRLESGEYEIKFFGTNPIKTYKFTYQATEHQENLLIDLGNVYNVPQKGKIRIELDNIKNIKDLKCIFYDNKKKKIITKKPINGIIEFESYPGFYYYQFISENNQSKFYSFTLKENMSVLKKEKVPLTLERHPMLDAIETNKWNKKVDVPATDSHQNNYFFLLFIAILFFFCRYICLKIRK